MSQIVLCIFIEINKMIFQSKYFTFVITRRKEVESEHLDNLRLLLLHLNFLHYVLFDC